MALSMATASPLFQEDSASLWEDVPRNLQPDIDLDEEEIEEEDQDREEEQTTTRRGRKSKNRRGRKNKRGRRQNRRVGKGRKGPKGKGKGKKFNYAEFMDKKNAMVEKKGANMKKRCETKQPKKLDRICKMMVEKEVVDAAGCDAWKVAMGKKCLAPIECKIATMSKRIECEGMFKAMMRSFKKDGEPVESGINADKVGGCFTDLLNEA